MTDREIEVFIDLPGAAPGEPSGRTERVGTLWTRTARGRESASFRYHPDWLASPRRFALEPAMQVGEGDFVPSRRRAIFGSLGDSAPDTWGRRLMQRAERRAAAREGRAVRTLTQADYLLGVSDVSRLGALRLREAGRDAFQAVSGPHTVPPLVELPRLLATTDRLHRGEESEEDVRLLFAPGSSLGGARPKASVRDSRDRLWIAKLAKPDDDYSIERWEAVAMDLAARAGIRVPEHDLVDIAGRPALLTKRFDRLDDPSGEGVQQRVPFLSALAMLDLEDGERSSYPEIVDALRPSGGGTGADAAELYRRVVFNVLVSNVDDHLRNHGFLWQGQSGWRLSPAFDLNPVPQDVRPRILSTNIDVTDGTCSLDLVRSTAPYYGLSPAQAAEEIDRVAEAASGWREAARRRGAPAAEIARMESAFEHEDMAAARTISHGSRAPAPTLQASGDPAASAPLAMDRSDAESVALQRDRLAGLGDRDLDLLARETATAFATAARLPARRSLAAGWHMIAEEARRRGLEGSAFAPDRSAGALVSPALRRILEGAPPALGRGRRDGGFEM